MTTANTSTNLMQSTNPVLELHDDAWAVWNASYDTPDPRSVVAEAHRIVGRSLYLQAVQERISVLNARSDAQNALLDALMSER